MGEWFTFIGTVITDGAAQFAEAIAAFTDMGGGDQIDWRHAQVERREAFVVAGRGNVRY
jgi:hypothetical protein